MQIFASCQLIVLVKQLAPFFALFLFTPINSDFQVQLSLLATLYFIKCRLQIVEQNSWGLPDE